VCVDVEGRGHIGMAETASDGPNGYSRTEHPAYGKVSEVMEAHAGDAHLSTEPCEGERDPPRSPWQLPVGRVREDECVRQQRPSDSRSGSGRLLVSPYDPHYMDFRGARSWRPWQDSNLRHAGLGIRPELSVASVWWTFSQLTLLHLSSETAPVDPVGGS